MFTEWIISALPYLNFFTQDEKDFIFDEEKCNFSIRFLRQIYFRFGCTELTVWKNEKFTLTQNFFRQIN